MKTNSSTVHPFTFARMGTSVARRIGLAVLALALFIGLTVQGATVIAKASNAAVHIGLPFVQLEFENPLAGTETVLGHAVLDWRDADYAPGLPRWYDDWTVSDPAIIDGNANEIWLRQSGHSAWTATTVPSTIVSIHLNGDNNDGIAQVMVDGNEVARLDMFYNPPGGGTETTLIVVSGLGNTTHTITVNDLGVGPGGGAASDDVAILGAAALKESPIKWNQPPVSTTPTNVFYGWNQTSVANVPPATVAADDWVCQSTNPVTKIRWWGSFSGWTSNTPPPVAPSSFQILIWNDVPKNTDAPFSHPGGVLWQINSQTFTWQFVGWDYDPRTTNYDACFLFEQTLSPSEYFTQPGGPGTVYWMSIGANYAQGTAGPWPWGWKTRVRDPASLAPDNAVASTPPTPPQPPWLPIAWSGSTNSWDLAFELISERLTGGTKWYQPPDLSTNGMDVNITYLPNLQPPPPPYIVADDFLCTSTGYLTNIVIWGSWTNDYQFPINTIFTLTIHDDIPVSATNAFSKPGTALWQDWFTWGHFGYSPYTNNINEWWLTPPNVAKFPGDHACFQINFNMGQGEWFYQQGTPQKPKVYWLSVQAQLPQGGPTNLFGWKTCPTNWNDTAVWAIAPNPTNPPPPWSQLLYPPQHPRAGQNVGMSFRLDGQQTVSEVKWSQPPVLGGPSNAYNGWNEVSWFGGEYGYPIIADDWACTTTNPVTDIHWWGSFVNWSQPMLPAYVPNAFFISFWTDAPTNAGNSFSHPGICLQVIQATNFACNFVGWDIDPRDAGVAPEACFKFDLDLATNWFTQTPLTGTNIYWISIAAFYTNPPAVLYPWGWKTRPRDVNSLAPDDAVRIFYPTWPQPGMPYSSGTNIWWPSLSNSWDMAFVLTTRATEDQDFGDAPDPLYPTLRASGGARHFILPSFRLGSLIDAETNGWPNWNATGDDTNNLADEDGVIFTTPVLCGTQAWAKVVLTSPWGTGQLDAWVDFNRNGAWETAEKVFNNVTLVSGTNNLSFSVPTNAAVGPTFARFRLSSAGGLLPAGAAADGEVEDYMVNIVQRRPATNIVITNIVLTLTNVTVRWTPETNVHYWLQATTTLSNAPSLTWSNIGSDVIGPANSQTETNALARERYYRVIAPYVWP
jgi:hypothetical protein